MLRKLTFKEASDKIAAVRGSDAERRVIVDTIVSNIIERDRDLLLALADKEPEPGLPEGKQGPTPPPRRKRSSVPAKPALSAEETVEAIPVSKAPSTRKKSTSKKRTLMGLIEEAGDRITRNDWKDAKPGVLVGAYARGHYLVHNKILPTELEKETEFLGACSAAARAARKLGSVANGYALVKWTWERERDRLSRNPDKVFRMGWRIQFSDSTINDFLADRRRRK